MSALMDDEKRMREELDKSFLALLEKLNERIESVNKQCYDITMGSMGIMERLDLLEKENFEIVEIKWKKIHPDAVIPSYAHPGDAGFDFVCVEDTKVEYSCTELVPTGLQVAIPDGYELQVRPRSGVSLKTGLRVANSPGTVDSGYRGEVKVIVSNYSSAPIVVEKGYKIAQGVICKIPGCYHTEVENLDETTRGEGGFGSTGTK